MKRVAAAGEIRPVTWQRARGPIRAVVCYPNTYAVGMANLGFLAVYRQMAEDPRLTADRAFPPAEGAPAASLEDGRPLASFDLVCFSVSYEDDFANVARMLCAARIPLRSADRSDRDPLVVCGGVGMTVNPEPLADLVDVVLLGDAAGALPGFLDRFADRPPSRRAFLDSLADLPHAYVPSRSAVRLDDSGRMIERVPARGFAERVRPARSPDGTPPLRQPDRDDRVGVSRDGRRRDRARLRADVPLLRRRVCLPAADRAAAGGDPGRDRRAAAGDAGGPLGHRRQRPRRPLGAAGRRAGGRTARLALLDPHRQPERRRLPRPGRVGRAAGGAGAGGGGPSGSGASWERTCPTPSCWPRPACWPRRGSRGSSCIS